MKTAILIAIAVTFAANVLPGSVYAKRAECKSGEELVFSIPEVKPEWIDKPHSKEGSFEAFVGLSTQNNKLEDGITLAVENANGSIVEALGQVIKKQSQGVLTFEQDEVKQSWGSAGAASYLQHKERRAIYYEKWAAYDKCKPKYHYNVWVQIIVPSSEFKAETLRAEKYLRDIQRAEEVRAKADLMPSPEAMQIRNRLRQHSPPSTVNDYLVPEVLNPQLYATPSYRYDFSCGSFAVYGGYTHMPSVNSEMGKQEKGVFNINFDLEWGLTRNFCMGFGMGWAMTKMANDKNGHIVPMFFRFDYKGPFDSDGRFIGWLGVEIGGVILNNFKKRDNSSSQKDTGAFMAGPAGGMDIRLQGDLYLTFGASYTPIFYKNTIHMVETRVGIRYYF